MAGFHSSLELLDDGDGRRMRLIATLAYQAADYRWFEVPVGFTTDFASIPQFLWSFGLDPHGRYDRPAVLHDYLYQFAPNRITRADADRLLRQAMGTVGVPAWQRFLIYAGVRLGGWKPWADCRRAVSGSPSS